MGNQDYRDEASWRVEMLTDQVRTRQSISELGFLIAGLYLAHLLSDFFPGLAIVVAAAMCVGAIYSVWRESRAIGEMTGKPVAQAEKASEAEKAASPGSAA